MAIPLAIPLAIAAASLIAGGGTALSAGKKAGKERKKIQSLLGVQNAENDAWYNSNAQGDYLQRADSQALLKNLRDNLKRQNKAAANMAVVNGATPEQQATQKEQSTKAISDAYSNLGAMGQRWKDNITNQYLARKDNLTNMQYKLYDDRAKSYETMMNNGLNMITGGFGAAGSMMGK